MTTISFIGSSIPTFVIGIICILVFAIAAKEAGLPYLPPGNAVANSDYVVPFIGTVVAESTLDRFLHFVMPCSVLVFVNIAGYSRFIRSGMLEVLRLDYVRTARAKGLSEITVVIRHGLSNALIPVVTVVGLSYGNLLSGAVLTESIFAWPGLGRYMFRASTSQDFPAIMGVSLLIALIYIIVNFVVDMLYFFIDPRIRESV
jgi:peptide/nickel transport system permease protein